MIPGRKIPPKGKKNQDEKIKMYEKNPLKCCQRIFSSRDSSDLLSRIDIKDFFKRQRCTPKTYCHKILAYGSDYMRKILCGINVSITAVCSKPMKFCLREKYKRKYNILIFFFLADSHRYTERNQEDGESKQRGRV